MIVTYSHRANRPGCSDLPAASRGALLAALDRAARAGRSLEGAAPAGLAQLFGVEALTVDGVIGDGRLELIWCDPRQGLGAELNELQFTLGDGPGAEVQRSGLLIEEPDLSASAPTRWPVFLPAAARTRLGSLVALPLAVGTATIGVLTAYRTTTGRLPASRLRELERLARALVPLLLNTPSDGDGGGGGGGGGNGGGLGNGNGGGGVHGYGVPGLHHAEIHQATGFLAERLGISTDQALLRLRGYAIAHDRPLTEVAREVLSDRLPTSTWH